MRYRGLTILCLLFIFLEKPLNAQDTTVSTIILIRHAEKQDDGTQDPPLSAEGKERAERLEKMLALFEPDQFFSTAYKRTRQTLAPLAVNKEIQDYDPRSQAAFAQYLSDQRGLVIVVAGHSNTIPVLANQLLGENRYRQLDENQYDRIWIITMKDRRVLSCHVLVY